MALQCPICRKPVPSIAKGEPVPAHFPFCSQRCKLLDLGKWLEAEYRIDSLEKDKDDEIPDEEQ
ncbi:MAG: hypothetical protein A2Y07_01635 [Planctomycetes bacterium GWF2_50_10]|nr:MAG: hypothetical protein A2Y07_01635 [Planctomycetes bacterium GWF2_50_10]